MWSPPGCNGYRVAADSIRDCGCAIGVVASWPTSVAVGGCRRSSTATSGPRRPPTIDAIVVILKRKTKIRVVSVQKTRRLKKKNPDARECYGNKRGDRMTVNRPGLVLTRLEASAVLAKYRVELLEKLC